MDLPESAIFSMDEPREWRGSAPPLVILNAVKDLTLFPDVHSQESKHTSGWFFVRG